MRSKEHEPDKWILSDKSGNLDRNGFLTDAHKRGDDNPIKMR